MEELNKENENVVEENASTVSIKEDTKKEEKTPKKKKKRKVRRPKDKKSSIIIAGILWGFLTIAFIVGILGLGVSSMLLKDRPNIKVDDLISPDSSIIYDNQGNKIYELGLFLRENVDYEQMPNCLIDAFVSIEDSRFFEHPGFDIPRFSKAILVNLSSGDFDQGGSTITMQLIKNTYYSVENEETSILASREGMSGVKRKLQEIVLSLQLEMMRMADKKEIISMYINKVNYGDNIRGAQKAAEYYFGKDISQINVCEAAFLAGIVNSPTTYNPYNELHKYDSYYLNPETNYLENAKKRRDEVLELMVDHGYISRMEADLYETVKIEDMLAGVSDNFSSISTKYQAYIDAVIDEVIETTGESPYRVGMNIYTNMNAYMQELVYDMQNEEEYTNIKFPNDLCQSAIVLMDNQNGAIEALGGGRGETDSARSFNRATSAYLNPGSSIKPIVDYALAIEKLGWATSHTYTDMPYYIYDGPVLVSNYDHKYYGDMMMTEALGRSQNTPAIQTLAAVVDEIKEEGVIDYLNTIGFDFEVEDFDLQFAIGGSTCIATPLQMAGAHAIFMNGGRYIKPHTIHHIEYVQGNREDFVADTKGIQAISKETAWMVAYLENYNMDGAYSSLMWYCKRGYPLYGKTGTTDWADAGVEYGIPVSATKDSWLVMQTNKYTISCWTGYDQLERGAYFTTREYQENTKSKLVSLILDELETHYTGEYDPYQKLEKPDTVVEIRHVKGAYPYATPTGGYDTVTGYISQYALDNKPLGTVQEALQYANDKKKYIYAGISNITGFYDGNTVNVSFTLEHPENGTCTGMCDLTSSNVDNDTCQAMGEIWFPHWYSIYEGAAVPPFTYTIWVGTKELGSVVSESTNFVAEVPGASSVEICISPGNSESQSCKVFPVGVPQ